MVGPIAYVGGKNRIACQIIRRFPKHTTYVEPFAGGAQVFFHKQPSKVEVLNDLDGEIFNFFRVCQWHHEELIRHLRYCLVSRRLNELFQAQNPDHLTDVQRAARFLYLQKTAFGGMIVRQNYHYHLVNPPNYNPERLPEVLEQAHRRLLRVQIENLPYEEILKRYDRPATLFYLDPPYWGRKFYRFNFEEKDFVTLRDRLKSLRGNFVLSINDTPQVRDIFGDFPIRKTTITYTARTNAGQKYVELLITNHAGSQSR
jgi:DNA adenine methylase